MDRDETPYAVTAWTPDFWRAFNERPRWLRWIARLAMGRYAWREIVGAYEALQAGGYYPDLDYGLQHMEYHQESIRGH